MSDHLGIRNPSIGATWPRWAVFIGVSVMTLAAARLASLWTIGPRNEQPFWPATGLTVAVALVLPRRLRWPILAAGLSAHLVDFGLARSLGQRDLVGLALAVGIEMLVGLQAGQILIRHSRSIDRFRRSFIGFILCFVMAGAGALTAALYWQDAGLIPRWLFSDAIGIFSTASLVFVLRSRWMNDAPSTEQRLEMLLCAALLVGTNTLMFHVEASLSYLVIAGLLWLSVRFGPVLAVPAAVLSIMWACLETAAGHGPFVADGTADIIQLQTYIATAMVATVLTSQLALATHERRLWLTSLLRAMPDIVTVTPVDPTSKSTRTFRPDNTPFLQPFRKAAAITVAADPDTTRHEDVDLKTGVVTHFESRSVVVDDDYKLTLTRDISRETQLLQQVQRDEHRWRQLAATGYEGFIEVDKNERITAISEGIALAAGRSVDAVLGGRLSQIFPPPDRQRFEQFSSRIAAGETVRFDRAYTTSDGTGRWALTSAEPIMNAHGEFDGCLILVLDTTDLHHLHAARVESEHALTVAQESERHRLAQTLHDGALQDFAAANLLVGALGLDSTDVRLARAEVLLTSGMRKLRSDAIGTDATDVSRHGIAVALEEVSEKFALSDDSRFSVIDRGIGTQHGMEVNALFRISREALVNAIVHSQADTICVELSMSNGGYQSTIDDNGIGFEFARKASIPGHLGLRSMAELSSQLGGWCTNSARPGGGTRVQAWIPLIATDVTITLGSPSDSAA